MATMPRPKVVRRSGLAIMYVYVYAAGIYFTPKLSPKYGLVVGTSPRSLSPSITLLKLSADYPGHSNGLGGNVKNNPPPAWVCIGCIASQICMYVHNF